MHLVQAAHPPPSRPDRDSVAPRGRFWSIGRMNDRAEPPQTRLTLPRLYQGLDRLAATDADLAQALAAVGPPPELRVIDAGFAGLLRIIVGQQVSSASAAAIWTRITTHVAPLDPTSLLRVLDARPDVLGLSRPKRAYARGLAEAVREGRLDVDALAAMPDAEAAAALVALKGFGDWSAGVYLLFALGRKDAWPSNDLALAVAIQRLRRLNNRPNRLEMDRIAESWRPWRGAVATFLWHFYHRTGGQKQFASDAEIEAVRPGQADS